MNIAIIGLGRVYQHYKNNFIPYLLKNTNELYLCDTDEKILSKESSLNKCIPINNINELVSHSIALFSDKIFTKEWHKCFNRKTSYYEIN